MTASAPEPRPSSTVVLVRDAAGPPEVFVVKRHARSAFGSAHAFPGGVLEPADARVHAACGGLVPDEANRMLGLDAGGLDYYSAAVRELFEEAGVLLGDTKAQGDDLGHARDALNDGSLDWAEFVMRNDLMLSCNRLHYFSFWITPPVLPKRYATRFFLAAMPGGQSASHCGGELTDSCWLPAQEILDASRNRTMRVHYPTRMTLQSVARFDSVPALCEWADGCAQEGVVCDQPAFVPEMLE